MKSNKINKLSVILSIAIAICLFACNNSNRQAPTLQDEQTPSETIVSEKEEANENKNTDVERRTVTIDGKKIKLKSDWIPVQLVEVEPLFDGKDWLEGYLAYFHENNNFFKIAKENGIEEEVHSVRFLYFVDTDGSVIVGEIGITPPDFSTFPKEKLEKPPYQLLVAEMQRLFDGMQGRWTPAKHEGEPIKVRTGGGIHVKDKEK